jgi:tetratricopeptide (TPR) repeat protein
MLRILRAATWILTFPARAAWRHPRRTLLAAAIVVIAAVFGALGYAQREWRLAHAALDAERPEEARSRLDVCLAVWPRSAPVHLAAARAARLTGDVNAAEAHLNRCLKLAGATHAVQVEFLLLRVQSGELDAVAPTLIDSVEKGHPETPLILETLSRAYMQVMRYKEAFACLSRWIEEAPGAAKPYQWRAWVYERLNRSTHAMEDYEKALELNPDLSPVRLRVAEMLLEDNDPVGALPHLTRLLEQHPDPPVIKARLGQCRLLEGRLDEARSLLEQAAPHLPNDLTLLIQLSKLDLQQQQPAQAEERLRRVLELAPNDPEALYQLATVLRVQGRSEESAATLKRYHEHNALVQRTNQMLREDHSPTDPDFAAELGGLLLRIDREKLGMYWLDRTLLLNPDHPDAHRALADYYDAKGSTEKAAAHRRRLEGQAPSKTTGPSAKTP